MSAKNLSLTLALALTLGVSGCASLKSKQDDAAALEAAKAAQMQADKDKAAADAAAAAEAARTSALNPSSGINSSGMDDGAADGSNGASAKGAGKNGGNEVSMADMLNVRLVHFDYDSADLSNTDLQTLQAHAQYLSQNPNAKVLLAGHADERGTREYNMALGERRANAVQAFLNSNGVKASQLDTVSYGKEKPLNDGHDEAAWTENRRVEITYQSGEPR